MPTYEYRCSNCGYEFEDLQLIKEDPHTHCNKCDKDTLERLIGKGSGIVFRGDGWFNKGGY